MSLADSIMMVAIPGFFVLMAIELLASKLMRRPVYRLNDSINSISLGVLSQVSGVFGKLLSVGIYAVVLKHVALFDLPMDNPLTWISALLLYDFCYYWLHRAGHEVGLFWAAHVVHHQSERYNLSTALRQTSSGVLFGWLFYLPMAILGYPLEVFATVAVIDLIYQYWVHTELVGRLGWFDRVFVSPSNHRVHHAVNDRYLDRNYGGILILWDRLFGSFIEEDPKEPVVFGTRAPLRSWNPLWANAEVYWALWQDSRHAKRWSDKLRIWFKPPGWRPSDIAELFPKPAFDIRREEFNPTLSGLLGLHALLVFALLTGLGVHFLLAAGSMPTVEAAGYAAMLLVSLMILGAVMESRRHAVWLQTLWLSLIMGIAALGGRWFGEVTLGLTTRMSVMLALTGLLALLWAGQLGTPAQGSLSKSADTPSPATSGES
ncbi:MAG: sterol desaturase family protein [Lysobacteraceae bacterium]